MIPSLTFPPNSHETLSPIFKVTLSLLIELVMGSDDKDKVPEAGVSNCAKKDAGAGAGAAAGAGAEAGAGEGPGEGPGELKAPAPTTAGAEAGGAGGAGAGAGKGSNEEIILFTALLL